MFKWLKSPSRTAVILLAALFFTIFCNASFFANLIGTYPVDGRNMLFLLSTLVVLYGSLVLLLALLCHRLTTKPVLVVLLLVASMAAYFMDTYHIIIDADMMRNVFSTDVHEAFDLLSLKLFLYVMLLGILPAVVVGRLHLARRPLRQELWTSLKLVGASLVIIAVSLLVFSSHYASFLREHKFLRYYANPVGTIYAAVKYLRTQSKSDPVMVRAIGEDARVPVEDDGRELVFFVVGEAARSDRFFLNGYGRETNPALAKEDVFSFTNYWACGTSTALSVPCMFSLYGVDDFSDGKARGTENLLDVLQHAGVNVLWLDNNSDSKGVALRVPYQSYRSPEVNHDCDVECRDDGMLEHVQEYIDTHPTGDIFIIFHQMGNHGPAYYKRYPPGFERFTPVCKTNQLEDCTREEIDNAYDNAILYTDYFLDKMIDLLRQNDDVFETALFYVSDHGESLGENGLYLHGLPSLVAPETQLRVPAIMWFGKGYDELPKDRLRMRLGKEYNHDNVFHTVLGLMEIETSVYDKSLDIIRSD